MATEADRTNTGVIFTVVVVGAFAMISASLLLAALVRGERREVNARRPEHSDLVTVAALKAEQRQQLAAAPAWKDKALGTVTISIESAMALVLKNFKANPESASPRIPEGFRLTPEGKLVAFGGATAAVVPQMQTVVAGTKPVSAVAPHRAAVPAKKIAASAKAAAIAAPAKATPSVPPSDSSATGSP